MSAEFTEWERLLELVSRLYFIENKPQTEIGSDQKVRATFAAAKGRRDRDSDKPLSQATINRLLTEARQLGVTAVSVDVSFAVDLVPNVEVAKDLRNRFRLQSCSVLETASKRQHPSQRDNSAGDPVAASDNDDRLILGLANSTARDVVSALAPGDHVTCGGGRTIWWLARAIRRAPEANRSKKNLIFTPLSGRLWMEDWRTGDADIMERALDADDAVHVLADAFEHEPARFSQINQPLYQEDQAKAVEICQTHCALGVDGTWNWECPNASWAFVGVGWLGSPNHRLWIFLNRFEAHERSAVESYLRVAGDDLLRIKQACAQADLPLPGDIANRLFACLPMPDRVRAHNREELFDALASIADDVEALNARAIVASWKHLRRTRRVTAIAGGRSKLAPLFTMLLSAFFDEQRSPSIGRGDASPIITELSTDVATARALLAAIHELQQDEALAVWYQRCAQRIGLSIP